MKRFALLLALLLAMLLSTAPMLAQEGVCEAPWPLGDKPTLDAEDCGFNGTLCNFNVVSGVAGAIDLLRPTSSPTAIYDLTERPGVLYVQSGPNKYNAAAPNQVLMYQDFTLGDGESYVIALAAAFGGYENAYNIGLWLSDSTTSPINAPALTPYVGLQYDAEFAQGPRIVATANNTHLTGEQPNQTSNTEEVVLLRIIRSGLTYSMVWSNNWGLTWSHVGKHTQTAARTKQWFASQSFANQSSAFFIPIHGVLWACKGGAGFQPWYPTAP